MPQESLLFVDAYDSFAENIAALLRQQLLVNVTLIRIDCDIQTHFNQSQQGVFSSFAAIVLGPGPGNPQNESDVGLFNQVWDFAAKENIPVLGICLGFQSLCFRYGLSVVNMGLPCHGHAKKIYHVERDVFHQSGALIATNYNSLGVHLRDVKHGHNLSRSSSSGSVHSFSSSQSRHSTASVSSDILHERRRHHLSDTVDILAWDEDDWVMAIRHRILPFHGFQFHPESCKSNVACQTIIKKWWEAAKTHNQLYRAPPLVRPAGFRPLTLLNLPKEHNTDYNSLKAALFALGGSDSSGATRKTLLVNVDNEGIAALCHQMSPSNTVVMLESTKRGRYSIYAFPDSSSFQIEYAAGQCKLLHSTSQTGYFELTRHDVVEILESFLLTKAIDNEDSDIPFRGGFMGFLSYEFGTASLNLDVPTRSSPLACSPEISLLWVDRSVVFDHSTGIAYVQSIRLNDDGWVGEMVKRLRTISQKKSTAPCLSEETSLQELLSSTRFILPAHDKYISQIRACQSELLAGNSYELCLTTEATATTPIGPDNTWLLYRNIQRHNPVPFAAYIRLNKTTILSSSPEQFLSWSARTGTIDMIPMKGTVKKTPDMTLEIATTFLSSAKESAENLMIADLIRHDLYSTVGRDAKVEVVKLCDVIETETVFSLVSHIRAHVPFSPGLDITSREYTQEITKYGLKALTRTLPPGSMTGAPKKRSCEILHRLEQRDRGIYSGAIGYMDVGGNGAWSVCIRTAFSHDDENEGTGAAERQKWRIGAGGAITVLSDEEQEWEEMMTKLDSVLRGFRPC